MDELGRRGTVMSWRGRLAPWTVVALVFADPTWSVLHSAPRQDLARLKVAPEQRCSPYESAHYAYPQSVEAELIKAYGGIYSPYTGQWFAHRGQTDIEHIVAKSEAHDSGMCQHSRRMQAIFARDLLNLTLASVVVNRYQKKSYDVAQWLPQLNQCWFAARVIQVKTKYQLTVDAAEHAELARIVSGCRHFKMIKSYPSGAPSLFRARVEP